MVARNRGEFALSEQADFTSAGSDDMAGGMDLGSGGKGGKKALDTTINLVPFIDLMAVTIVFLIMTAVWTQLGRLQVSQSGQSEGPTVDSPLQPVTLVITEKDLKLSVGGVSFEPIAIARTAKGKLELSALMKKLLELKAQQPEQSTITLSTEDGVKYDDLVQLIDHVVQDESGGALFPSVSVAPASGA